MNRDRVNERGSTSSGPGEGEWDVSTGCEYGQWHAEGLPRLCRPQSRWKPGCGFSSKQFFQKNQTGRYKANQGIVLLDEMFPVALKLFKLIRLSGTAFVFHWL